jgi:hypothetical protein
VYGITYRRAFEPATLDWESIATERHGATFSFARAPRSDTIKSLVEPPFEANSESPQVGSECGRRGFFVQEKIVRGKTQLRKEALNCDRCTPDAAHPKFKHHSVTETQGENHAWQ